ncbi:MAG: hypothetical protein ACRDD7_11835 [Peptostreptococcaceae bacterium]
MIENFQITGIKNLKINGVELPVGMTNIEHYSREDGCCGRYEGTKIEAEMLGRDIKKVFVGDNIDELDDDSMYTIDINKEYKKC